MADAGAAVDKAVSKLIEKGLENHAPLPDSYVSILGVEFNVYGAVIVLCASIFFLVLYRAVKSKRLDWCDLITRDGKKVSATKILQMVGGFVATWIVVKMTLQRTLSWDIFAIYLAYVASIDGFAKVVAAKYGLKDGGTTPPSSDTTPKT